MAEPAAADAPRRPPRTTLAVVIGVVLVVAVIAVGRWAVTPFDDWVPLVPPTPLPEGVDAGDLPVSAHYRCSAAFGASESVTATPQAEAALEVQTLSREPCDEIRRQHQVAVFLNLGALVVGALVFFAIRRRRAAPDEPPDRDGALLRS